MKKGHSKQIPSGGGGGMGKGKSSSGSGKSRRGSGKGAAASPTQRTSSSSSSSGGGAGGQGIAAKEEGAAAERAHQSDGGAPRDNMARRVRLPRPLHGPWRQRRRGGGGGRQGRQPRRESAAPGPPESAALGPGVGMPSAFTCVYSGICSDRSCAGTKLIDCD